MDSSLCKDESTFMEYDKMPLLKIEIHFYDFYAEMKMCIYCYCICVHF